LYDERLRLARYFGAASTRTDLAERYSRSRNGQAERRQTRGERVSIWLWVLIILLIVPLLGGFGYSRR
jgi:ABC-type Fe3+ transport system permease subunit